MDTTPAGDGEAALRGASTLLYRSLIEAIPAVVYIDSNEVQPRSLYVSPQCVPMFGRRPEEFLADRELWGSCIHPEDRPRVFREWEVAVETGERFGSEYRWVKTDGDVIWVRDDSVLVRSDGGEPVFWQGLLYDITPSKAAEEAMFQTGEHYRFLLENIPAIVYMVAPDDDRRTIYASSQIERALGYSLAEWLDQPDMWMELLHPDDREPTLAEYDAHNETGAPWIREYRLIASDGRALWFRDVANLVRDEQGRPQHWLGVQFDVTGLKTAEAEQRAAREELELRVRERTAELEETNELMALEIAERRRVEEELRTAELRYRSLVERIPAVTYIWEVDPDLEHPASYTSPRIEQLLGYTVDEWQAGVDFWMLRVHPDDRKRVTVASLRSENTGTPFSMEYRYLHKDGHIVWVLDRAALLTRNERGRPKLFQGVMMDITDRKEAQSLVRETALRYRSLAEQVNAIIYVTDLSRRETTYVGPQLETMLGYTIDDWRTIEGRLSSVHPDDREHVTNVLRHVGEIAEPYVLEYRVLHKDGSVRWLRDQASAVSHDAAGRPIELQGLLIDITSTRRAEQEREETATLYRTLVEQIPAATYIELAGSSADDVHLAYLSPQIEAIFGRSAEDLLADPGHFATMLHPDDRERVLAADDEAGRTGEPFDAEFRIVRPDGTIARVHSRAALVRGEDGTPLFWHGVAIDVTAQRETEAALRELEARVLLLSEPDELQATPRHDGR